ncbi:Uncharacterized protein TCM_012021 [Theobroma cacao]|uniref:Uncharacterized protein n=1 Tax=Theobroma cacao TaxID=3641 RepID=A0A061FU22_THECC|nr:Uncharacterized protein TCM_012021 [Theobroma cacao]
MVISDKKLTPSGIYRGIQSSSYRCIFGGCEILRKLLLMELDNHDCAFKQWSPHQLHLLLSCSLRKLSSLASNARYFALSGWEHFSLVGFASQLNWKTQKIQEPLEKVKPQVSNHSYYQSQHQTKICRFSVRFQCCFR